MFSNLSESSISLATVTPSLVVRGAPKDFSITTLRPLGPSVTFTALARMSTPRSMRWRASVENFTSLEAMCCCPLIVGRTAARSSCRQNRGGGLLHDPHDVGLLHDQQLVAVDLDLGARPL